MNCQNHWMNIVLACIITMQFLCIDNCIIFLNYFAFIFGQETNLRKDALDKIQEVISKEHELVSLGGQAAAAAHSFGTPLSTIKIISHDLFDQFKDNE